MWRFAEPPLHKKHMTHPFLGRPPRLKEVFQNFDPPLYFVTFCTWHRAKILACDVVHASFIEYATQNLSRGIHTGRYVLMPDHIHLFVSPPRNLRLENYVRLLKQHLNRALRVDLPNGRLWQPGFFDHLVRANESYRQKWEYVLQNPVRAGLVKAGQDWPYQGEIERIDVM